MQNRTLLKDGGRCMRAPQRLPVPQRLTTRRCSAPFQEPAGFRTPSLQSIQDAADTPEGYVSPMMSLDWMEQPSLYGQGSAAAVDPQLLEPVVDVCGVGQCLIDVNVNVSKEMLATLNVPHGGRRVIGVEERDALLRQLEQVPSAMSGAEASTLSMFNLNNVTPGGSLLNTLVGLSRLGTAASGSRPLSIAMAGCVGGSDRLGTYVRQQLRAAGVSVVKPEDESTAPTVHELTINGNPQQAQTLKLPKPMAQGGTTGTVMVFCTPDAQRSFLSCIPNDEVVVLTPELLQAAARSRLLVIEGYLFDLPGASEALPALVEAAKAAGTVVALTMGDAGVVHRSADAIAACIKRGTDLLFANAGEALALTASDPVRALLMEEQDRVRAARQQAADGGAQVAAGLLGSSFEDDDDEGEIPLARSAGEASEQLARLSPMVVVTDGSRGSYVSALGSTQVFPPRWSKTAPVDTCGAGDNYAAGLLYALLRGLDISQVGQIAAHTASAVIARHGPQLDPSDARKVVIGAARALVAQDLSAALGAAAAVGGGRSLMSVLEARALLAREEMLLAEGGDNNDAGKI